jgi:NTP pyrophosphatase (non-canonical NTP hydrolase)
MTDKKEIENLIEEELHEANKTHPLFSSPHEAYAVLNEECCELADACNVITDNMKDMWHMVRNDASLEEVADATYFWAIHAACEAIQVAAMCKKIKQSGIK